MTLSALSRLVASQNSMCAFVLHSCELMYSLLLYVEISIQFLKYFVPALRNSFFKFQVAVLWRKDKDHIQFDYLEDGWYSTGADLQRSARRLTQLLDWLLQSVDILQYNIEFKQELIDEHAQVCFAFKLFQSFNLNDFNISLKFLFIISGI